MNKNGRPRESKSIRSMGLTYIAVDKPCRDDLKAQAEARGLTLVEYLRFLVEGDGIKNEDHR